MYLLLANPETFEIHKLVKGDDGFENFELVKKMKPPHKEIYEMIELTEIDTLNMEQIMEMMYSDDEETRTIVNDIIKNFRPENG